jgi:hypothetical protein
LCTLRKRPVGRLLLHRGGVQPPAAPATIAIKDICRFAAGRAGAAVDLTGPAL